MAFTASTNGLLERLEKFAAAHLDGNWVAEPKPARLALLVREELRRWTQSSYPGASCEGAALDPGSRRRLCLTIHSAPVSHRVEIWGLERTEALRDLSPHTAHSWVVLAGEDGPGSAINSVADLLLKAGLRRVDRRDNIGFSLSLWMGAGAPDGCPECLGKT
ncbi:MAG TPA: hypothetical protein VMU54_22415 [Planctomycetota bacterium]|nr:hypothetical protein [Planctomycetota bacterium]